MLHQPTDEPPEKVFSIHRVVKKPWDPDRFMLLHTSDEGEDLWMSKVPLMHSKFIEAMEVVRGPRGMTGLKCYLKRSGRQLWSQVKVNYAGQQTAVLIDGELAFLWRITSYGEEFSRTFIVEGPWSREEAAAVAAQARLNFQKFKY